MTEQSKAQRLADLLETNIWEGKCGHKERDEAAAELRRLDALNAELVSVLENFEVRAPDEDGLVWLVLHGNGTTGKAMFNLRSATRLAAQVALLLEESRITALAKAKEQT